jgi:SAM-dependent methyltransferase
MSDLKQRVYPESQFGGFSDVDGTVAFYLRVNALLPVGEAVIDFGCGRGAYGEDPVPLRRNLRILKGKAGPVIGLDVDPAAQRNPYVDQFHFLQGERWPVEDACAGLVVCDSVLEHLEQPGAFFAEASRVLRPGGYLCIRTPNLRSYVALASRLVPNRRHVEVLERVKEKTQAQDVFPTLYRCNTIPAIRKSFRQQGFEGLVYGFAPEPAYLSFSGLAYRLGAFLHRHMPRATAPVLFAFGQRRPA